MFTSRHEFGCVTKALSSEYRAQDTATFMPVRSEGLNKNGALASAVATGNHRCKCVSDSDKDEPDAHLRICL